MAQEISTGGICAEQILVVQDGQALPVQQKGARNGSKRRRRVLACEDRPVGLIGESSRIKLGLTRGRFLLKGAKTSHGIGGQRMVE